MCILVYCEIELNEFNLFGNFACIENFLSFLIHVILNSTAAKIGFFFPNICQ